MAKLMAKEFSVMLKEDYMKEHGQMINKKVKELKHGTTELSDTKVTSNKDKRQVKVSSSLKVVLTKETS